MKALLPVMISFYACVTIIVLAKEVAMPFVYSGHFDWNATENGWGTVIAVILLVTVFIADYLVGKKHRYSIPLAFIVVIGIPMALLLGALVAMLKSQGADDEGLKGYWRCQLVGSMTLGWLFMIYLMWAGWRRQPTVKEPN